MGRSRNFHSKKNRVTRKKGGVTFKTSTYRDIPNSSAIALHKQYSKIQGLSLKKRRKYVNDVSLIAPPHATNKQKNASFSRSNTALTLGKRYAPLNEAYRLRKLLTNQLHALESMEKTLEKKHYKDEDDKTERSEIKSNINEIKYQLLAKPPHSVNIDEQDTSIYNKNRYISTAKRIQSLRETMRNKLKKF
jgi:hypothetical protein